MKRCILAIVLMSILLVFSSCASNMPAGTTTAATIPSSAQPLESTAPSVPFYDVLAGKTAIYLGDSICAGTSVGENIPEYRYGWAGLIGEVNGMNWRNYGRNGAVITHIPGRDRIIAQQVDTALQEWSYVDYVILEGGVNDADLLRKDPINLGEISPDYETFDISTFTGAFESLIKKVTTAYPNAKIAYIIPPKMGRAPYDSENNYRRQYFDRAVEVCEKWEIPYLDLWNESEMNPNDSEYYIWDMMAEEAIAAGMYYTDGQHLTLTGYLEIAPLIEEFMRSL